MKRYQPDAVLGMGAMFLGPAVLQHGAVAFPLFYMNKMVLQA